MTKDIPQGIPRGIGILGAPYLEPGTKVKYVHFLIPEEAFIISALKGGELRHKEIK